MAVGLGLAKSLLWRVGLDVQFTKNTLKAARKRLFRKLGTDLVLDVGANRGQYATELRQEGYAGKIVSFEPIPLCIERLRALAARDPSWQVEPVALGSLTGERSFHISENLASSSFFKVLERSTRAAECTRQVHTIQVQERPLDAYRDSLVGRVSTHLKLDTQGAELEVLRGATQILPSISSLECEFSLTPLYEGQPLIHDVLPFLAEQGFRPTWFERGFYDQEGQMLQLDGLFVRERPATAHSQ